MRTTVSIDDDLLREARASAVRTGRTLGDVVDDALRLLLSARSAESDATFELPTMRGSGLMPGVDLDDRAAMAALLDEDRDRHAAG